MYKATNEFDKMGNTEELEALIRSVAELDELHSISMAITPDN